jgi:hypothetical protein
MTRLPQTDGRANPGGRRLRTTGEGARFGALTRRPAWAGTPRPGDEGRAKHVPSAMENNRSDPTNRTPYAVGGMPRGSPTNLLALGCLDRRRDIATWVGSTAAVVAAVASVAVWWRERPAPTWELDYEPHGMSLVRNTGPAIARDVHVRAGVRAKLGQASHEARAERGAPGEVVAVMASRSLGASDWVVEVTWRGRFGRRGRASGYDGQRRRCDPRRRLVVGSPGGISPPGSHGTERDSLPLPVYQARRQGC